MTKEDKQHIANELIQHTHITREQYKVLQGIVDDLGLELPEKEESWDDVLGQL